MPDPYRELGEKLKRFGAPTATTLYVAKITAVQTETCTIDIAGSEYPDVRLRVTEDPLTDKVLLTPTVGSTAIVADLSDGQKRSFAIIHIEQIDKIAITKGTLQLKIDANGFAIMNNGENLKTLIGDFIDEVCKIIVVQGTTPNVPALQAIKARMALLLQ